MANETTLNMTLLLRRAKFDDSCVLKAGEPGYHIVTKEFKIGDGTTAWGALAIANKTQIDTLISTAISAHAAGYYTKKEVEDLVEAANSAASQVAADLATEVTARTTADTQIRTDFAAADTQIRTDFAAADASTLAEAKGYADTKKAEVIGTSGDAKTADTVYGAKAFATDAAATAKSEAISEAAADAKSKADAAEAAAKSHAEAKASAAQTAAIAEAESKDAARAQAAATNLANAVSALETKITNGDSATLASAKEYTDEQVAAEAKLRSDADADLDERLEKLEAFFEGADHDGETGGLNDALDTLVEIQTYIETEGAAADQMVKDIAQNASDIDALEGRMSTAEGTITSLGTNKLDKSTYEDYIEGKSMSDAELKSYADGKANTAQANAEAKAAELDTALHTEISKEIDAYVKAAIDAEVTRSNAYADQAEADAKSYADSQDTALQTNIVGGDTDTTYAKTIKGAKDFADAKATAAKEAAISAAAADATSKANAAQANAEAKAAELDAALKTELKSYADQAEADAVAAVVGTANDTAEDDTINGLRKAIAAGDSAAVTSANQYTDAQLKAAAAKVKAGTANEDIIVTPDTTTGETTVAHKTYGTGSYTAPASVQETHFVTGINVSNGHVTGASVKSLAEALRAMTFIFDGGTSATTVE